MVTLQDHPGRDIDFPGRHEGEEFQFFFRQHWIRLWHGFRNLLVWTVVFGVGIYIVANAFGSDTPVIRRVILVALSIFFLFTQLSFLVKFYSYFLYVIIVTDKKIHRIKKTMLTTDDHQSVDLWTLEDITKNQHGIIQNIFGFGSLVLISQTQEPLRVHFTPSISDKHEVIMSLREQARKQMMPQQIAQTMQQAAPATEKAKQSQAEEA
jgi:hypothetical protein